MIRVVVVIAIGWAIWRKTSRRRKYRLGLLATAGLSVIGACLGGVTGDLLSDDSRVGDLIAGAGAVIGCVAFVYVGEMLARRKPEPPPRKLAVSKRFKKR